MDRGVAEPGRRAAGLPGAFREDVVIRRTPAGWRVEGSFPTLPTDTVDELGHALALADLLAESTVPGPRPPRPVDGLDELTRLRASIRQLEHALASRVVVEQAIGVLTERWRVAPRDAFEQLRRVTRSHGMRIHDLARQVIDSATDPEVLLPAELVPARGAAGGPPEPRQSPDRRVEPGKQDRPEVERADRPDRRDGRERRARRGRGDGRRNGLAGSGSEPAGEQGRAEAKPPARTAPRGGHARVER